MITFTDDKKYKSKYNPSISLKAVQDNFYGHCPYSSENKIIIRTNDN